MKKVLVTGAEGFIGSHLTELLVRSGYRVRATVLYNSFNSRGWLDDLPLEVRESVEVVVGDIRDPHFVRSAISGCDLVAHLAALIGIPYSYVSPESYLETNIRGTLNILQASRDMGIEHVIHTSTSEVYGSARYVPMDENHPLSGQSPYSASKIAADQLAFSFWASFGVPISILRPFNTYGPRQSTRAVIPTVITQFAAGKKEIFLGDTSPTRDFSFVHDTAMGFLNTLEKSCTVGEVTNIGSGFEISISEVVEVIASAMEVEYSIGQEKSRIRPPNSEVQRLFADTTKASDLIDWKPNYGGKIGFESGIRETVQWFRKPENLEKYRRTDYTL